MPNVVRRPRRFTSILMSLRRSCFTQERAVPEWRRCGLGGGHWTWPTGFLLAMLRISCLHTVRRPLPSSLRLLGTRRDLRALFS